ncbi:response regulator transcription factor [Paeniglutamicibacter cryotolerans]|uniref:response regulator transcription factor n=1 Tax=Paeniglutamicibacter cryotolerans TaxID=670079 RepID=UPI00160C08F0|nr:response regulator transcription factor [Paeniglutamicibacter cryotolerans]
MEDRRVAVVVEDDEDIRGLLEAVLQQSGFLVHCASGGASGVDMVLTHQPELVTLDLGLPDIDGFEVARRIRGISDAHVLMLTARAEEIDMVLGLESGADDYMTKPFRPRELRARVEAIMRRRHGALKREQAPEPAPPLDGQPDVPTNPAEAPGSAVEPLLELNGLCLAVHSHSVMVDGAEVGLTPTEFLLLKTLLSGGRRVHAKADLVRRLRDEDMDAGTYVSASDGRAVEVHLGNLRRKLGDSAHDPRWIETVRGIGYRAAARRQTLRTCGPRTESATRRTGTVSGP